MGSGSGDGGGIGGGHRAPTVRVRSAGAARSSCPDRDPAPGFGPGSARWRRAVLPLDDAGMHHREDSNLRFRIWNPESWPLDDRGMTSAIARSLRISAGLPVAVIAAQPCRRGRTVRSGGVPRSRTWFYRLRGDGISAHACTPMWGKGELEGSATARWPLPRLDRGTPRKRSLLPCLKDRCIAPMLASHEGLDGHAGWSRTTCRQGCGLPRPRDGTAPAWYGASSGNRTRVTGSTIRCPAAGPWKHEGGSSGRREWGAPAGRSGGCGCGNCTHLHGL